MTDSSELIYEETLPIRASDCDFGWRLKPAVLFRHLSEAAGTHATRLGVGYEAMLAQNLIWVNARMQVAFHRTPRADDIITIRTWPRPVERRLLYMRDFEVFDARNERLATATSAWLIVNAATHRLVRPGAVDIDVPTVTRDVGLDAAHPWQEPSWEDAESGMRPLTVRAGYSAVDVLGHVNNSRYIEWICDAFPLAMFREQRLDRLHIAYTREVLPGEEVAVRLARTREDPALWAVAGENLSRGARAFEALVRWRDL